MANLRCAGSAPRLILSALMLLGPVGPIYPELSPSVAFSEETLSVDGLCVEYKTNPIGIDTLRPRLSWRLQSQGRGVVQSSYQIRVALTTEALAAGGLVWDSGRVASDEPIQRLYSGPKLESGKRYYWQVRVRDGSGHESEWSGPAFWEMGLLDPSDWKADWIEPSLPDDPSKPGPVPMLRREFKLNGQIKQARAYVTSHGLYELWLNGDRVGDALLTPGWTSYNKRLQYQVYDVTAQLKNGGNAVGALLGDGWYRGGLGGQLRRNFYGDKLGLLLQIKIDYADGREEIIGSDQKWRASTGPILSSEIYAGESYDARLEKPGWSASGFDDRDWVGVKVVDLDSHNLIATAGPPVRRIQELTPVKIFKTPGGDTVVDMGQDMVGWVRLRVQGPAGTTVTLRHAEMLDHDGNFYTANLRNAKETIQYTLKGGGPETFEPHFTFQGFRYVAVRGYPGTLDKSSLTGIVVHSDIKPASEFVTSNPLINQLQHNIIWGQKGNFVDVPTDCPQRDERMGWTGDAEVFAPTAEFNAGVAAFFTKWLGDVAADQYPTGSVPFVIPDIQGSPEHPRGGAAGWADVAVIIPWTMYLAYADRRILEVQYPSMVKWVEYMRGRAGSSYLWKGDFHFGDWLAFASSRPDYPGATTSKDFIATAFFAHSTDLLARAAKILGKNKDAVRYADLFQEIKAAFCREYVTAAGRVGENTQTAYALALEFNLLPDGLRAAAAKRLADDVRQFGHLTTGFLGTPYLCDALSDNGYLDSAYFLLNRQEYPSWLYEVRQGATTIWERWDGLKPDGTFQDKAMNSFNHYAYGAVGSWMYRVLAGINIDPAEPGYKHVIIEPRPGGGFTSVRASHESMYGPVSSAWTITGTKFDLEVSVPPCAHATVRLPRAAIAGVTESGRELSAAPGVTSVREDHGSVVVDAGSGDYHFAYEMKK